VTISGDYSAGGITLPFTMTRSGDAHIEPPVTGPLVDKNLEGTWNATLAANGLAIRVVLTLMNGGDGRSSGHLVNLDQGGLTLPLAIAADGASVTLTSVAVPAVFRGALDGSGDLVGTFSQGSLSIPVTFRRAVAGAR
jgi:hypothetical protein